MVERDLLVAAVALGLGLVLIGSVLFVPERISQFQTFRRCEDALGPIGAKILLAMVGMLLVSIGIHLGRQALIQSPPHQDPSSRQDPMPGARGRALTQATSSHGAAF